MRRFTRAELSQYDGRAGRPAFFAYAGKVYDVTGRWLWRDGRHWVLHTAGMDLTAELAQAPHGEDMLRRVPVIGLLAEV